ncbi:MAG: SDR family oxidoreductase [Candidatus Heimdallarchaeota archaeon]|nr:SDR family oxidoreductase [Candidatus Heimdallarchaeota archaeon]
MKDKIVLITGATDGIGKQTALEMLQMGAHVILHGRNETKMGKTVKEIREITDKGNIDTIIADLASFDEIRTMAAVLNDRYDRLDILLQNAGVQVHDHEESKDGFELTLAVNHLAYFLLTSLLMDLVDKSDYKRIVLVSSGMHAGEIDFNNLQAEKGYSLYPIYAVSKLCNLLFGYKLGELVQKNGITVNCLHPGLIDTNLNPQRSAQVVARALPVDQGSISTMYLATSPEMNGITGKYYNHLAEMVDSKPVSYDKEVQDRLWKITEKLIGESFKLPQ